MGDVWKCKKCGAHCCKTVGVEIDTPKTKADFEFLKWYLFHEGVEVYKDRQGTWNVQFSTRCKKLDKDNMCSIYHERPEVCSGYSEERCDTGEEVVLSFETPEDVDAHMKARFGKRR
ncbi:YkgJ family cysteine cluster protein [Candidatus Woesearchaeota archaeon]|nr:YkgJ family cysteine cluster protein [Candidatus Woesearchaeota archaeon]